MENEELINQIISIWEKGKGINSLSSQINKMKKEELKLLILEVNHIVAHKLIIPKLTKSTNK